MSREGASPERLRRLFIAVFPPPALQAAVHAALAPLRAAPRGRGVSWVREANLHFTLRFLGDCDSGSAAAAADAVHEAAASRTAFPVALGALGAFPDARRARVLWAGLAEGAGPLVELAEAVARALANRGVPPEPRPFAPHLTLGRVREPADWSRALAAASPLEARFEVRSLRLVQSTLAPGGARYEVVSEARL